MSKLFNYTIEVESREVDVTITAQRIQNDINGNPRHSLQVWIVREDGGNLWSPKVKGYRLTKNECYIIQSYNLDSDVNTFIDEFEKTINGNLYNPENNQWTTYNYY